MLRRNAPGAQKVNRSLNRVHPAKRGGHGEPGRHYTGGVPLGHQLSEEERASAEGENDDLPGCQNVHSLERAPQFIDQRGGGDGQSIVVLEDVEALLRYVTTRLKGRKDWGVCIGQVIDGTARDFQKRAKGAGDILEVALVRPNRATSVVDWDVEAAAGIHDQREGPGGRNEENGGELHARWRLGAGGGRRRKEE